MKSRSSFVSNSSSSSFIVAMKKSINEPCEKCGRKPINIVSIIEQQRGSCCDDTRMREIDSFITAKRRLFNSLLQYQSA
jgi:hypothetical protein